MTKVHVEKEENNVFVFWSIQFILNFIFPKKEISEDIDKL